MSSYLSVLLQCNFAITISVVHVEQDWKDKTEQFKAMVRLQRKIPPRNYRIGPEEVVITGLVMMMQG